MKRANVRFAGPQDAENILKWGSDNIGNADAFLYPAAKVLASENGKPLQYALIHSVCMLEGMAPNPDASALELVRGLKLMIDVIKAIALASGMKEIIALTGTADEKLEHLMVKDNWALLPYCAWRKKI